ncbi:uncharacterized protein LOC143468519 isoform X1 [Clavelina lepadiformis]|uniref:uncharacterized protein LOC143468519 isoform X1 n=1 Tax=Clavelina lepadiformis TaxID=159417 RepID=UPI0040432AB7
MAETLTYADRVKRQWNNDVAEEYSNHCEVTIQLTNDSKREDIYKMLKETKISLDYIEGIIQKPGNMVNITLDRKNNAIRLAELLRKRPEVKYAIAHGDERIDLTIRWVPIHYPQKHIDAILAEYEIQGPARLGVDKYGIKDGRRIYKVNKKTLERHQLPSYLYLGKIRCAVSYFGQIQTCSFCTEQGHKFKECPKRRREDERNERDIPMTTAQTVKADGEGSPPPPSDSKKIFSALAGTIELLRGKYTKDTEKSRAGAETPLEESPQLDPDERSSERPLERDQSDSRGNKRKNRKGESDEQPEEPEAQGFMDGQIPYDASDLPQNLTRMIPCSCGQHNRIRRNKSSSRTIPNFKEPNYCKGCTAAFMRCACTSFAVIRINNRLKSFQCKGCEMTYEPNTEHLNVTVN